jgi:fucose 4-O-acetylase-like acetyltransferase
MTSSPSNRDDFLDIAKGIAIILVVIGHTLQYNIANVEDNLWFRIIYAFHMPLFVFLSGAVASLWFNPSEVALGARASLNFAKARVSKAFKRLFIPFVAWTVIALIYKGDYPIGNHLLRAFREPDRSLWFLLCIFYCIIYLCLFMVLFSFIYIGLNKSRSGGSGLSRWLVDGRIQVLMIATAWLLIRDHSAYGAGAFLARPYFIYFILGIGFYKYCQSIFAGWKRLIPYLLFSTLVPFWSRTLPDNLVTSAPDFLSNTLFKYFYSTIVALSGTFVIVDIVNKLCEMKIKLIQLCNQFLAHCGKLSLGIYAIQFYFLTLNPKGIAPLFLSILISMGLLKIPYLRTVLLGAR